MKIKLVKSIIKIISVLIVISAIIIGWKPLFCMSPKDRTTFQDIISTAAAAGLTSLAIIFIFLIFWAWGAFKS